MVVAVNGKTSTTEGKLILDFGDTDIAIVLPPDDIAPVEYAETFDDIVVVKPVILGIRTVENLVSSPVALNCHFDTCVVFVSFVSGIGDEVTSLLRTAAIETLKGLEVTCERVGIFIVDVEDRPSTAGSMPKTRQK